MTDVSHQQLRCWLAGLAAALALLLWPGSGQAIAAELARGAAPASPRVAVTATPTPRARIFLPLVIAPYVPSSFTLIERALARGEIDAETALIYRVFVTFGDARLPARLRGDDRGVVDADAVAEATQRFAELSPAARATLIPFLIPPVYAGSWYDVRMNGQAAAAHGRTQPVEYISDRCGELAQGLLIPLESAHFVVWYPPFDASFAERALKISSALETRIHPILTQMFRQPLGDAGLGCNPSDGRLDVYLVYDEIPTLATALAAVSVYPGQTCRAAASYMLVLKAHPFETSVIAHEFMHMIQYAYNPAIACFESWWMEATADWAMDYFDTSDPQPDEQFEHESAVHYLRTANRWLVDTEGLREYGAYLWPFYLSHYTGQYHPEIIAQIFAAAEDAANGNLYQVINDKIAGGWEKRWPEFALFNLNLPPYNRYEQWDNLQTRWDSDWIMARSVTSLGSVPFWAYYLGLGNLGDSFWLGDLGIYYEEINIDEDVRLWAFANEHAGDPTMQVQALLWREGQGWTGPEDWSGSKWHVICQDDPAQRVQKALLIISNSNWRRLRNSTALSDKTRFVISDLPCTGWQGTATWQIQGESRGADAVVSYTIRGEASPTFTLSKRTLTGDVLQLEYQPTGGNATWTTTLEARNLQTGQMMSCTRTGSQALAANLGGLLILENLNEDLESDLFSRRFYAAGLVPAPDRCPGLDAWANAPWLQTDLEHSALRYWPDFKQGHLQGSASLTQSGEDFSHTTTSTWNLRVLPPAATR